MPAWSSTASPNARASVARDSDADAEAIMAAMLLVEAEKAKTSGAEAPTLEEFIQMLAA